MESPVPGPGHLQSRSHVDWFRRGPVEPWVWAAAVLLLVAYLALGNADIALTFVLVGLWLIAPYIDELVHRFR